MVDNLEKFGLCIGEKESLLVHMGELISFYHLIDFSNVEVNRQAIIPTDTNRTVFYMPSDKEAHETVMQALLSEKEIELLNNEREKWFKKIDSSVPREFQASDQLKQAFTLEVQNKISTARMSAKESIQNASYIPLRAAINEQFSFIGELALEDLKNKVLRLNTLKASVLKEEEKIVLITMLREEITQAMDKIVKDLSDKNADSDFVTIKREPLLPAHIRNNVRAAVKRWGFETEAPETSAQIISPWGNITPR